MIRDSECGAHGARDPRFHGLVRRADGLGIPLASIGAAYNGQRPTQSRR
jgi:hypothetical protein